MRRLVVGARRRVQGTGGVGQGGKGKGGEGQECKGKGRVSLYSGRDQGEARRSSVIHGWILFFYGDLPLQPVVHTWAAMDRWHEGEAQCHFPSVVVTVPSIKLGVILPLPPGLFRLLTST